MKNTTLISLLAGLLTTATTTFVYANELSEQNLVTRSLTLKNGEIMLSGAANYGKTGKLDDSNLVLGAAYGLTDDLTVGLGGARYRLLKGPMAGHGLEVTIGAGIKGNLEQNNEDALGYGADVIGKYVVSEQLAFTFGSEYVFWNKRGPDNAKEYRYSVGAMYSPIQNITVSAGYTYRDLDDFSQDKAYTVSSGINYASNEHMDVGLILTYSDFDPVKNGFDVDSAHKRNLRAYVSYRF